MSILLITVIVVFAVIMLAKPRNHVQHHGEYPHSQRPDHSQVASNSAGIGLVVFLLAAGLGVFLCVVLLYFGARHEIVEHGEPSTLVTSTRVPDSSEFRPSVRQRSLEEESSRESVSESDAVIVPSVDSADDQPYFVLPITSESLARLLGPENAEAIEALSDSLPENLPQAYALIPVPSPVADGIPDGLERFVSSDKLTALAAAISSVWNSDTDQPAAEIEQVSVEVSPEPAWVSNPGLGRVVVELPLADPTASVDEALMPAVGNAFREHVQSAVKRRLPDDIDAVRLVDFSLTERAFRNSVVETHTRFEDVELTPSTGAVPMRKTYALVEFTPETEHQAVQHLTQVLQHQRMIAVGVVAVGAWGFVFLTSILMRARRTKGKFRMITVPVIGLLIIPCVVAVAGTITGMMNNEIHRIQEHPAHIAIDVQTSGSGGRQLQL